MTTTLIETGALDLKDRLGLTETPRAINTNIIDIFENGVMATVRIGAERFGFSIKIADLGIVPTRKNSKDKTQAAIDAVLRGIQRASLLPRDQMWYMDETGRKLTIPRPENSERAIRMLFPTRYDDSNAVDGSTEDQKSRMNTMISAPTVWAIPLNGMTFIPEASFSRWKEEFDKAKESHLMGATLVIDNYDRIKAASVRHYERIAIDVYNRLAKTAPEVIESISILEFTRRWKRAVIAAWPSKKEIEKNFLVESKFYWVPLPSRVQEDVAKARQMKQAFDDQDRNYQASSEIRKAVLETQSSQVHELTTSYIKTILERTEHVFINFLKFLDESDRSPTPAQLNAVLKVVDMIKVLGMGINTFDDLRLQAQEIEKVIENHKVSTTTAKKTRTSKAVLRDQDSLLPEALAKAVQMMRMEAEALIGTEARRTVYNDKDPGEICKSIFSGMSQIEKAARRQVRVSEEVASSVEEDSFFDEEFENSFKNLRLIRSSEA